MRGQQHSTDGLGESAEGMAAALARNEALVHWTVQRQWLGRLSYQDAVQEGRIALWRALVGYDASRGELSSYAVVAIQRSVWQAARRARRLAAEGLAEEVAGAGRDLALEIDRATERVHVRTLVAGLPARLGVVIRLRYGLDGGGEATFPQIGAALGVTKQRAEQLHREALLCLSDPASSAALRQHAGRNTAADYRAYLARRRAWQRRGRSRR